MVVKWKVLDLNTALNQSMSVPTIGFPKVIKLVLVLQNTLSLLHKMKKLMMALAAALISAPALADPIKDMSTSPCILGCMLLRECTDHVKELKTVSDLNKDDYLVDVDYDIIADEFNSPLRSLNAVGGKVFLADEGIFLLVTVVSIIL